jgi:RNA polymerase sigma-70 factor (ECF subfamily)
VTTAQIRDDGQLLSALSDGDMAAMRTLYDRHAPWLSVRLTRRCNDREVVADVLQDTFVAVWRDASRFRGEGDVAAWLWGIAIRRLVSRLRSRRDVVVLREVPDDPSRNALGAEEQVLLGIEYGDLGRAMSRLSPEMRAVMQATVLDGLTTREAARLLGIPQNTVKTRLHRAKAQLRVSLAEEGRA